MPLVVRVVLLLLSRDSVVLQEKGVESSYLITSYKAWLQFEELSSIQHNSKGVPLACVLSSQAKPMQLRRKKISHSK
ncbi:MAG: hypothetical protein J3Q66DRAFT_340807 [Benniella sp.]|nr:MAG: hypothetical protein J3Q66DRAFT_340807 [Benniella sp.]